MAEGGAGGSGSGLERLRARLLRPPRLTAAADLPLDATDIGSDNFDLGYRLGPIYDILRHPRTRTPLSIAVYGDWGSGKTSAMKWLEARLRDWNAHLDENPDGDAVRLVPVWFYPSKYQEREDVWRGLVAEVIVATLRRNEALEKAEQQAKALAFLGRGFRRILSGVKLKFPAGEVDLGKVLKPEATAEQPEADYLNEFESALKGWLDDNLGDDERLIVFIDDLDRCMPPVALQVLEALKLYLNLENLIFVVGVDRAVINELVTGHYRKLELSPEKSRDYLGKMFQVEVTVAPSEREAGEFLKSVLADNDSWAALSADEKNIFRPVLLNLARRSSRETKRLVNSALIAGEGIEMSSRDWSDGATPPTLAQGIQVELIRRIVRDGSTLESRLGSNVANAFFAAWSGMVGENPSENPCLSLSESELENLFGDGVSVERSQRPGAEIDPELSLPSGVPDCWRSMLGDRRFHLFLPLLADTDLGALMRVPFSVEAAERERREISPTAQRIVDEAIASELKKKPEDLTTEDRARVTKLDLSSTELDDLAPLSGLTNLRRLYLTGTQVNDVGPLSGLTKLQDLYLTGMPVKNVGPLSGLTNLLVLYLNETEVRDVGPLSGLTNLPWLSLNETEVSDIGPLSRLTNLQELYLNDTQVSADQVAALQKALPNLTIER
jgi:hypothetical protein